MENIKKGNDNLPQLMDILVKHKKYNHFKKIQEYIIKKCLRE